MKTATKKSCVQSLADHVHDIKKQCILIRAQTAGGCAVLPIAASSLGRLQLPFQLLPLLWNVILLQLGVWPVQGQVQLCPKQMTSANICQNLSYIQSSSLSSATCIMRVLDSSASVLLYATHDMHSVSSQYQHEVLWSY